jgi:hypothetical protein
MRVVLGQLDLKTANLGFFLLYPLSQGLRASLTFRKLSTQGVDVAFARAISSCSLADANFCSCSAS